MGEKIEDVSSAAIGLLRSACNRVVLACYLLLWSKLHKFRMWLTKVSRWALAASLFTFAVEFFCESFGASAVVDTLKVVQSHRNPLLLLIALAMALVLWHEFDESRKPEYEFRLIGLLHNLMAARCERRPTSDLIWRALQTVHYAFEFASVAHISIHTLQNEELVILPENIFPKESSNSYQIKLKPKDGVAGRVFDDTCPRYVPRLSLFGKLFPHGIKFRYSETMDGRIRRFKFIDEKPEENAFVAVPGEQLPFKSFLSVPIRKADGSCLGVLNIDFLKTNPLDSNGIATAVAFAFIFGDIMSTTTVTVQPSSEMEKGAPV